jgi:muramoyltetrapeptide carboxypeptidase
LEHVDFERITPKWIMGYSDISILLLAVTLRTGIATAHGTNLIDLRGEHTDHTTAMWEKVLTLSEGESVLQKSSPAYQTQWPDRLSPNAYNLTEPTRWKTVGGDAVSMQGRLLGGCIDVIRHLIGTPYGDVQGYCREHIRNEPTVWYLENCELNTADLRRSLVQMKYAGWFDGCAGLLFGRSPANMPMDGYTAEDVYRDLAEELQIPVVYDIDCGHQPPQLTLVNGAFAEIVTSDGEGAIRQHFTS